MSHWNCLFLNDKTISSNISNKPNLTFLFSFHFYCLQLHLLTVVEILFSLFFLGKIISSTSVLLFLKGPAANIVPGKCHPHAVWWSQVTSRFSHASMSQHGCISLYLELLEGRPCAYTYKYNSQEGNSVSKMCPTSCLVHSLAIITVNVCFKSTT